MTMHRTGWLATLLLLPLVTACGTRDVTTWRGTALASPLARPSFELTDMHGERYDFVSRTEGRVALVFFGYTHCPDICPLHMAHIAAALRGMSPDDRSLVTTHFVTTDPERDTPERLRTWLASFDSSFVGLTGTAEELTRVQGLFNLRPAAREYVGPDSANYFVSHAAHVFAFARDGHAYTVYPAGTDQGDWANDLVLLARDASGAGTRRALAAQARARVLQVAPSEVSTMSMGGVFVTRMAVAEPVDRNAAAAYLTLRNDTPQEDTLLGVIADVAESVEIHETVEEGSMRRMMAVPRLVIQPRSDMRLEPGGRHLMLMKLQRQLVAGDSVTLTLTMARVGAMEIRAAVMPRSEVGKALSVTEPPAR